MPLLNPVSTFQDDLDLGNEYILADYGGKLALGFHGTPDFIRRAFNFTANTDITRGRLYKESKDLSYVMVRHPDKGNPWEVLHRGFAAQFFAELAAASKPLQDMAFDEDDNVTQELVLDDATLTQQAERAAETFIASISRRTFMLDVESTIAPVYETPLLSGRMGSRMQSDAD